MPGAKLISLKASKCGISRCPAATTRRRAASYRQISTMKTQLILLGAAAFLPGLVASLAAADFVVHEWGTFTSVSASDGRMLPGLEVEDESLPAFVESFPGYAPRNKAWDRPVAGVP